MKTEMRSSQMVGPVEKASRRIKAAIKKPIRLQIIESLGGKCMWPGGCAINDPDMIDIDHANGGGEQERRRYQREGYNGLQPGPSIKSFGPGWSTYYKDILIRVLAGSKEFQLLCANHNRKK